MIKTISSEEDQERYMLFKFISACNFFKAKALGLMRDIRLGTADGLRELNSQRKTQIEEHRE